MSSPLEEHLVYLSDEARLNAFQAAIARSIKPGDLVADVGCGFGNLGIWCLRAGAAHVWGIDSTGAADIARETLQRLDLIDRFTIIKERSFGVDLPKRVDLVVCDHTGHFGLDYNIVHTLGDARRRFLKLGGTVLPRRIRLMLAPIESVACRAVAEAWTRPPVPEEFAWLREHGINTRHPLNFRPDELLGPAVALGEVDLTVENPDYFSFRARLTIARDGHLDGLGGWHETEVSDGVWMTNSPLAEKRMKRAQAFLPLDECVPVQAGDTIEVSVATRPADGLISWSLVTPAGRRIAQSTFKSWLMFQSEMSSGRQDHVPKLTNSGTVRKIVLEHCDGKRTVREIEDAILRDHPKLFPNRDELSRVVLSELARSTE